MPYQIETTPDMEDDEEFQISVVDVYDLASDIGKEFEKIIDRFGTEALTSLMPRVICALEQLEKLAANHENSSGHIQELKTTIIQLENEKLGKIEDRQKYEKELEEIEDRLREESHELVAMVTRLQDENRKLSMSLAKSEGMVIHTNGCSPEIDMKVVTKLKDIIEGQREQIRRQERESHENQTLIDSLTGQRESLHQLTKELRRRQRQSAAQMRSLIDERADLQAALQEEQRHSAALRQRLGLAEKENQDLSLSSNDSIDLSNKVVYDRDDPNRPRFTMLELKEILYERNELKARVSDLEDELSVYRPSPSVRPKSHIICPPIDEDDVSEEGASSLPQDESLSSQLQVAEEDSDPPVQGPMPYEPDDAPWKRKGESGIRKFFRKLFGEEGASGTPTSSGSGATSASRSPLGRPFLKF
ncbi:UNVERIFIED_CONTAM: hypothetical protein RMT77_012989 [Armadillidium vulgare]